MRYVVSIYGTDTKGNCNVIITSGSAISFTVVFKMPQEGNSNSDNLLDECRRENLRYRKWALIPVLFFYVFGGGMTLYIVPEYIQSTIKHSYQVNNTVSNVSCLKGGNKHSINDIVQQESAKWNIYLALAAYVPAIFMNLVLGSYSDVIGRKTLIVFTLSGMLIKVTAVMIVVKLELRFHFLVIANLIEGFTGSFTTLLAVSFSCISDLTVAGNQRTLFIVLLELVLALSYTASSITVGYFIRSTGFFYPSAAGTFIAFIGVVIAAVALPETLRRMHHSAESTEHEGTGTCLTLLQTLRNIWTLYIGQNSKRTIVKYMLLLLAFMFTCIPEFGNFDTLYQLGSPFCWSPTRIGWYAAFKTSLSSTAGLFSVYLLKKCLPDEQVAAIGIISMLLCLIVEALATSTPVLYLVPVLGFMNSLPIPMIRSLMSHMTSPNLQGALFASIGAVETLCLLLGSLTTNAVYSATLQIMNGFVFLVSAMYAFVAFMLLSCFVIVKRHHPDELTLLVTAEEENGDFPVDLNIPD